MLKLYSYQWSGNCYKVRLLLSRLGIPFEVIETDIVAGEARTSEYMAKNPNGKTPMVEFGNGSVLAESNAILYHFAQGTELYPEEPLERARTMSWMFFEQNSHEPNLAVARFILKYLDGGEKHRKRLMGLGKAGNRALGVMEQHLQEHDFFPGDTFTIADIALYAYTHVADEGGYDLAPYPAVGSWLKRVARQRGHIPMSQVCG